MICKPEEAEDVVGKLALRSYLGWVWWVVA